MYIPSKQDKAKCRKGINCEYGICDECQMTIHDDQEDEGDEIQNTIRSIQEDKEDESK